MERKSETTIHDIARKLKISASTVSRALNDNPMISEKTRKLIKKTALEMGYRPNIIAANFRTKRTNTIGVIVPLINRHFFSSVISGIEEIAYSEGFTVSISQSNDNYQKEVHIAQSLFSNRVDGLILSIGMETIDTSHLKLFSEKNIPLVFFDRTAVDIDANKIVVDDIKGGYKATSHLIKQGYKRIAHIGGPLNLTIYKNRLEGYARALKEAGINSDPNLIVHNSLTREEGTKSIKKLMDSSFPPDAVFCANDTSALSVIIYLQKTGINIPNDFGVVGFSNEPFSEVVTPSISTIKQPGFEMGKKASELLIGQINGNLKNSESQTFIMPTELIVRDSSNRN
ncbi:MAG: LacI family DNA-binding transcriptional regulator [Mariniphaga sp.]|nr:LacI family DNA-binding transcriptional regulator [Mariniphaga sp.]